MRLLLLLGALWLGAPAHARDVVVADDGSGSSDDDVLDDILDDDDGEESVREEVEDVKAGRIGDEVGTTASDIVLPEERARKRRIIKTVQRKNFLKLSRWEVGPHVAFVANDPFLSRYILGASVGYNLTEIFELVGAFDFSPDLRKADWKPLTHQLVENNHVSPDISKLTYAGSFTFQFSPIYGKVAVLGRNIVNFDIFGNFGMGLARTVDDLEALQVGDDDPAAKATQFQLHPTTNFGGGLRITLNPNLAVRVEGRSLVYIETISSTVLEMKNNFILQGSVAFFFPHMSS